MYIYIQKERERERYIYVYIQKEREIYVYTDIFGIYIYIYIDSAEGSGRLLGNKGMDSLYRQLNALISAVMSSNWCYGGSHASGRHEGQRGWQASRGGRLVCQQR